MQLNYPLLTCLLVAVASVVPNYVIPSRFQLIGLKALLTYTSQSIDRRAVADVLAARASTKGSVAPGTASTAPAKASVAPAKNSVRVMPVVNARAAVLQPRASATAKSSAAPAKASVAPVKNTARAFPAGH